MKYILLLLSILLVFGCVSTPIGAPPEQESTEETEKTCRTVTENVPKLVEECGEVAYTEEDCGKRELEYNTSMNPISHLCWIDGECGGKALSTCTDCLKAATRCTLLITNNDEKKSGTWVVGANFSLGNSLFARDPVTKTIEPGETAEFDFQHFYDPGKPINSATCDVFIVDKSFIEQFAKLDTVV
jgi:hypothetical protein